MNNNLKKGTCYVLSVMTAGCLLGSPKAHSEGPKDEVKLMAVNELNLLVYKGVNIFINDASFLPMDVNGNEVYPFIYEGTTYLPARAISNAIGANINWNSNLRRVEIDTSKGTSIQNNTKGRQSTKLSLETIKAVNNVEIYVDNKPFIPTDVNGKVVNIFVVNGTTYLPVRAISNLFNIDIAWEQSTSSVYMGKHIIKEQVYFEYNSNVDRAITDGLNKIFKYYDLLFQYKAKIDEGVTRSRNMQDYGNGTLYDYEDKYPDFRTICQSEIKEVHEIIRQIGFNAGNFNNFEQPYLNMLQGIYEKACINEWKYSSGSVSDYEDQARIFRLAYENIDEILYKMSSEYLNGQKQLMDDLFRKMDNKLISAKVYTLTK